MSDDYPFKYYEPPIPAEELQAKIDKLLAENANWGDDYVYDGNHYTLEHP